MIEPRFEDFKVQDKQQETVPESFGKKAKRSASPATERTLNYNLYDWLLRTKQPQESPAYC